MKYHPTRRHVLQRRPLAAVHLAPHCVLGLTTSSVRSAAAGHIPRTTQVHTYFGAKPSTPFRSPRPKADGARKALRVSTPTTSLRRPERHPLEVSLLRVLGSPRTLVRRQHAIGVDLPLPAFAKRLPSGSGHVAPVADARVGKPRVRRDPGTHAPLGRRRGVGILWLKPSSARKRSTALSGLARELRHLERDENAFDRPKTRAGASAPPGLGTLTAPQRGLADFLGRAMTTACSGGRCELWSACGGSAQRASVTGWGPG